MNGERTPLHNIALKAHQGTKTYLGYFQHGGCGFYAMQGELRGFPTRRHIWLCESQILLHTAGTLF